MFLVGGFNPFEKYARQNGFIFPNFRGENKKWFKPPPSKEMSPTCFFSTQLPRCCSNKFLLFWCSALTSTQPVLPGTLITKAQMGGSSRAIRRRKPQRLFWVNGCRPVGFESLTVACFSNGLEKNHQLSHFSKV